MGKAYKGKIVALTLFFSLFLSGLYAQDAYISGTVTDKKTGETLIGANVVVQGTTFGVSTDLDGRYVLTGVTPGDYDLWITYIGYEDQLIPISLKAGDKITVDATLGYGGAVGLDEVVVTAQAKGQMNAINRQLNSKSITNVVSGEKMQELPDANAAETLGRLPGVSVARTGGEGNKVVVRGLSPKYNRVTMEGVQMASAGDDRSTDISSISPYALGGIEVYKAATADKNAEFIGGMVEFKLREAREGWNSDIVAQMGANQLKGTYSDYLVNASISNRFFDNDFGVYVQANAEKRNRSENRMAASYIEDTSADLDNSPNNKILTKDVSLNDVFRAKQRMGATVVMDYRLEEGSIKFKNFYSGSTTDIQTYGDKVDSYYYSPNSLTHSGQDVRYESSSYSNILSYDQRFNKLKIDAKVSHSYAKSTKPYQVDASYIQTIDVFEDNSFLQRPVAPSEVLDKVTSNEELATLHKMMERSSVSEDRQLGASIDLSYDYKINDQFNGFLKIGADYRATTRSKDEEAWGSDLDIASGRNAKQLWEEYQGGGSGPYPFNLAHKPDFDHRDFMEGRYNMGSVVDIPLMNDMMRLMKDNGENGDQFYYEKSSTQYDYSGTEQYFATYILTEINLGSQVKFTPGMRYESNTTSYTASNGVTQVGAFAERDYLFADTTATRDNWYLLPMIHLKYKPLDWFDVRVAYTHTLSRPSFSQVVPRMDVFSEVVSYNNYNLVPEYSVNWDIYFTFHSNKLGLFSIGGFTKKIDNMIFDLGKRIILSEDDYNLPTGTRTQADGSTFQFPSSQEYLKKTIYTTANSKNQANMYGVEIDWQSNFYFLPGAWRGIVMNINYTHIFSEMEYPYTVVDPKVIPPGYPVYKPVIIQNDRTYTAALIDQPKDILNIGLGWDYKGFSARASMFYQTSVFKKSNQYIELSTYNDDYLRFDFTAKQKLPWAGIELYTNMNNITSAKDVTVVHATGYDANISNYGMTIDLGVRWRL
ncbi:MAG: TonB-dependent receptor [Flavobacteriales bacterium]|nr:TonB-dependent receptor [Flavobacteriales bacterium]